MKATRNFQTYGLCVTMKEPPLFFGPCVQEKSYIAGEIGVTENCRLSSSAARFSSLQLVEKFRESLIPIFDKRYGEGFYDITIFKSNCDPNDPRIKRNTEILKWRLENQDFNPKHKP